MNTQVCPSTELCQEIMQMSELVVSLQQSLTQTHALSPEQGGTGEVSKADFVAGYLTSLGFPHPETIAAPDARVPDGYRPNLILTIPGESTRTLWIFSHLDVVAAGDLSAWQSDPWQVVQQGDLLYGRGVEDNQQSIVSSLLLAKAIAKTKHTPHNSLGLIFLSDEESGNTYGLAHVLAKKKDLFHENDLYLIPDFGTPNAAAIEIAEKAIVWLKITVSGKQCHASTPDLGCNALVVQAHVIQALTEKLPHLFADQNPLFTPDHSTFVPSKQESSLTGINILPGKASFHLDCRLLPSIDPNKVIAAVRKITTETAKAYGATSTVDIIHSQASSAMPSDHPDLALLTKAINTVYHSSPQTIGLGGGTFAGLLRQLGLPAMVFACLNCSCHEPNEHSSITATLKDACVMAHLLCEQED